MKKVSITEISRYWWWVLLCALLGSAIFNAFSFLIPTQYESQAAIKTSFDFSNSAYWNDITMLKFTQSLEQALYSPETLIAVLIQADQVGIELTETSFRKHTSIEQHNYGWVLTTHFKDATTARTVASLWSSTVVQSYQQDRQILLNIFKENQAYETLVKCLQQVSVLPDHPTCSIENLPTLQSQMQKLAQNSKLLSSQLNYLPVVPPKFTFVHSQETTSPTAYISTFEAALPLFGAIAGIAIGIITLVKSIPQNILKKVSPFPFEL